MRKKSLNETNPYLKDPAKRQAMIARAVLSSSAIEGVRKAATKAIATGKGGQPTVTRKSAKSSKSPR
jgi:hypothetical protein